MVGMGPAATLPRVLVWFKTLRLPDSASRDSQAPRRDPGMSTAYSPQGAGVPGGLPTGRPVDTKAAGRFNGGMQPTPLYGHQKLVLGSLPALVPEGGPRPGGAGGSARD